jgi:hypothetical protein
MFRDDMFIANSLANPSGLNKGVPFTTTCVMSLAVPVANPTGAAGVLYELLNATE